MMLPNLARSALTNSLKLARVPPMGSMPITLSRSVMAGFFMAASTAAASLSMISGGTPTGA